MRGFADYSTWVFDCDGVLLDSNKIKTQAFREAVLGYGSDCAEKFVEHHILNGGVSRYRKFEHFFQVILGRQPLQGEMTAVLGSFADLSRDGLRACEMDSGIELLMQALPLAARKLVVSGSDQEELRAVMAGRGLGRYFSAIYGSPDTKNHILEREIRAGRLAHPSVFIGDSRLDYLAACDAGLDFIFVSHWTEFEGWREYFDGKNVLVIQNLNALGMLVRGT